MYDTFNAASCIFYFKNSLLGKKQKKKKSTKPVRQKQYDEDDVFPLEPTDPGNDAMDLCIARFPDIYSCSRHHQANSTGISNFAH